MHLAVPVLIATVFAVAVAGDAPQRRATSISPCDHYTQALFTSLTGTNERLLLTLIVHTAMVGNYTQPNVGVSVPGILNPTTYNGQAVNLLQYFDGALASSFDGHQTAQAINWLDDGGIPALKLNQSSNTNRSNQYNLFVDLYAYFGVLLGCTLIGSSEFRAYQGDQNQWQVHKYMGLSNNEVQYFIQNFVLAAQSIGFSSSDLTSFQTTMNSLYGQKCSPTNDIMGTQGLYPQSICTGDGCPLDPQANCSLYQTYPRPQVVNSALLASPIAQSASFASSPAGASQATGSASAPNPAGPSSAGASPSGAGASPSGTQPASASQVPQLSTVMGPGFTSTVTVSGPGSPSSPSSPSSSSSSSTTSSSSSLSAGAAAGIGVGVAAAIILLGVIAFLLWRRRRRAGVAELDSRAHRVARPPVSSANAQRATAINVTKDPVELDGVAAAAELESPTNGFLMRDEKI